MLPLKVATYTPLTAIARVSAPVRALHVLVASEASFLVCSMHGFSIYISVSGRTSCRKCSKCFYVYLNIRPVRYSARIASARRQQLRTARQLRTAQSPKERDARLQQLRTAREQTIATEATEERQTRLQQLRSAGGDRGPSSTVKYCSATGLLSNRIAAESTEGREARLKQLKTAKHFQVYMSVRSVSTSSTQSECLRCTLDKHSPKLYSSANNMNPGVVPLQLMVRFYTSATLCCTIVFLCI